MYPNLIQMPTLICEHPSRTVIMSCSQQSDLRLVSRGWQLHHTLPGMESWTSTIQISESLVQTIYDNIHPSHMDSSTSL
jgi:hypothetical protein